jgi:hypothetical protein
MSSTTDTRGGIKTCIQIFAEETGKKFLGKSKVRWKVNIKKKLKGIGWEVME